MLIPRDKSIRIIKFDRNLKYFIGSRRTICLEGSTIMTEYDNVNDSSLEQLLFQVRRLQQDIENLFTQKEMKKQALLNACKVRKYSIKQNIGMSVEEAKQILENHRKRFQAAIRASESAKKQMKQAEKTFKEATNKFKRSSYECEKQEKDNVKKISKEFSNQIRNKQKELRDLEHKIKTASQKLT